MNTLKKVIIFCLLVTMTAGAGFIHDALAQPGVSVPVESFYDELAPYGQWAQHPAYGNVWQPNAGPDFQPYASDGHWIVTEYGNTWVSDYAWGWGPFHYGRWVLDPAYGGWIWIPGTDWGPAWVSWRSGGGYYGWAPLGPGIDVNVNINIPAPYWTFVPQIYINSPQLYSYRVPRPRVVNIYQQTTIINNVYRSNNRVYAYGPPRYEIERLTRRPVTVYRVDQLDRPGRAVVGNGSVGFYRPGPGSNAGRSYGQSDRYSRSPYDNGQNYGAFNNTPSATGGYNRNYGGHNRATGSYPNATQPNAAQPGGGQWGARNYPDANRGNYTGDGASGGNVVDRSGQSRGGYNPGGTTMPDSYGQRPGRSYEMNGRQSRGPEGNANVGQPSAAQPGLAQPGGDRNYQQQMPESRGRAGVQEGPIQAGPRQGEQRGGGERSNGGERGNGGGSSRGPR